MSKNDDISETDGWDQQGGRGTPVADAHPGWTCVYCGHDTEDADEHTRHLQEEHDL